MKTFEKTALQRYMAPSSRRLWRSTATPYHSSTWSCSTWPPMEGPRRQILESSTFPKIWSYCEPACASRTCIAWKNSLVKQLWPAKSLRSCVLLLFKFAAEFTRCRFSRCRAFLWVRPLTTGQQSMRLCKCNAIWQWPCSSVQKVCSAGVLNSSAENVNTSVCPLQVQRLTRLRWQIESRSCVFPR